MYYVNSCKFICLLACRDISFNLFAGPISQNVIELGNLLSLKLSGNMFSGDFPTLSSEGTIVDLHIDSNNFTGSIEFIARYKFIENLYADNH